MESWLSGLWIRVECAWEKHPRAWISLLSLKSSSQTPVQTNPCLGPQHAAEGAYVPRRLPSQEGGLSWGPPKQEKWVAPWLLPPTLRSLDPTSALWSSQQTVEFWKSSTDGNVRLCQPHPSSAVELSLLSLQGWDSIPSREAAIEQSLLFFLCFTVLLMLRCSTVSSNVGFVVSAQLMDLGIMCLWDISVVFGAFLPWKVKQRSLWITYLIRSWWMIYLRCCFLFTKKDVRR